MRPLTRNYTPGIQSKLSFAQAIDYTQKQRESGKNMDEIANDLNGKGFRTTTNKKIQPAFVSRICIDILGVRSREPFTKRKSGEQLSFGHQRRTTTKPVDPVTFLRETLEDVLTCSLKPKSKDLVAKLLCERIANA